MQPFTFHLLIFAVASFFVISSGQFNYPQMPPMSNYPPPSTWQQQNYPIPTYQQWPYKQNINHQNSPSITNRWRQPLNSGHSPAPPPPDPYKAAASASHSRVSNPIPSSFGGRPIQHDGRNHCGPDVYKTYVYECLYKNSSKLLLAEMSFPVRQEDLQKSCSLWMTFFFCIREKIQSCSNHKEFTKDLKLPISPLQSICTNTTASKMYLVHGACMKDVVLRECPKPYQNLIARISSEDTDIMNYCCDGLALKQCAMAPLKRECSTEAANILASTLGFLEKCGNYIPPVPCPQVQRPLYGNSIHNRVSNNKHSVSNHGHPDPRILKPNNDNNNINGNTIGNTNANNNDQRGSESRVGNGRLVQEQNKKPEWRPNPTPQWPVNPLPAERKSPPSSSNRLIFDASCLTLSSLIIWLYL